MSHDVQDFDRDVIARSRSVPVLVDFWAPWCGPCKMLGPVLESLAQTAAGRWELVKVNTEERQDLAMAFQVSSIPAVKLYRDGRVVDEFVGFMPEAEIRRWLERNLPSAATERLEQAAELIDNGQLPEARRLLEEALAQEPERAAAKLLLAETLLQDDPDAAARLLDGIPVTADEHPHAEALRLLASVAERNPDSLPEHPVKPRLVAAIAAIRNRDWESALAGLADVLEQNRTYADGLAAEAGKAIFRYLGVRHPVASRHYRRFSSALNA